jgi:hypothetical protein
MRREGYLGEQLDIEHDSALWNPAASPRRGLAAVGDFPGTAVFDGYASALLSIGIRGAGACPPIASIFGSVFVGWRGGDHWA